MKRMFSSITLGIVFLIACNTALSQVPEQLSPSFSNLTLEISTNKSAYMPLEPIAITFKIKNTTNQQVLAHNNFNFFNQDIKLSVRRSGSSFHEIERLSPFNVLSYITPAYLQPGQQWQSTNVLNYALNTSFGEPGTYQLKAKFRSHRGREVIISSPLTIEITQPTGNNLSAYEFLKANTNASAFFADLKDYSVIEEFVTKYQESDYGDFAVYLLGTYYLNRHEYDKAQISFEYLSDRKDFPLSKEVTYSLNESRNKLRIKDNH